MTDKFVGRGDVIDAVAGGAIVSGQLVKASHSLGIALKAAASGETYPLAIEGVFQVPKVAGTAWAAGEKLVYKTGTNSFNGSGTAVVAGDITGGAVAVLAAASGDTVGYAKLTPGNTTLT